MKKSLTLTLASLSIVCALTAQNILVENFESSNLGSLPSNWILKYPGSGGANQKVIDSPVKNGSKAFQMEGRSGNAAEVYFKIPIPIPEQLTVEAWVYPEKIVGTEIIGSIGLGDAEQFGNSLNTSRLHFANGKIKAAYYGGAKEYEIQAYEAARWYHLRVEHNLTAKTYKVYIDGVLKSGTSGAETLTEFPMHPDALTRSKDIVLWAGYGGDTKMIFDDIKLYETIATTASVNISSPGTLSTLVNSGVSNLTVTGTIDARDIKYMRDELINLVTLDLSGVSIAAYTGSEGTNFGGEEVTYPANEMPSRSFAHKWMLTSCLLPNSMTSIGESAFEMCNSLTGDLTIPDLVTSIGRSAFMFCHSLNGVLSIPASVTSIGDHAFEMCFQFSKIIVANPIPLAISFMTFDHMLTMMCKLEVPKGSQEAYKTADIWSEFMNISQASYDITVLVGAHGTVKENNVTLANDTVLDAVYKSTKTFVITANENYELAMVSYNDEDVKSQLVDGQFTTSEVIADATLSVTFAKLPYGDNLLTNPSCDNNNNVGWTPMGPWYTDGKYWTTDNRLMKMTQTVDLAAKGFTEAQLEASPYLLAAGRIFCQLGDNDVVLSEVIPGKEGTAKITVELLDASNNILGTMKVADVKYSAHTIPWTTYAKELQLPLGTRKLKFYFEGSDCRNWGGANGPRFDDMWLSLSTIAQNVDTKHYRSIASGNWDGETTWESTVNVVPAETVNWEATTLSPGYFASTVSIREEHEVTVAENTNAYAYPFTVEPRAKLTLGSGATLTTGIFTLQSNASGTATFVDNDGTFTGTNITAQQYFTTSRDWYVSIPVKEANSGLFRPTWNYPLRYFVEPNNSDVNTRWAKITTNDVALSSTKGYVTNLNPIGMNQWNNPVQFYGSTLNTGNLTTDDSEGVPSLTRTAGQDKAGFNLVGNPYPSYLKWSEVVRTDVDPTIWYTTKVGNVSKHYTYLPGNGVDEGISVPAGAATNLIPPMQAFWVRVSAGQSEGSLGFSNSMRAHRDVTSNILKAPAATKSDRLLVRLQVSNGVNDDETVIYFNPNASDEFDVYDSPKLSNDNVAIPEIYSTAGAEKLVINGMNSIPFDVELALGFMTGQSGSFTLTATELSNLDGVAKITVLDKLRGVEEVLVLNESYTFDAEVVNTADRFSLFFRDPAYIPGPTVQASGVNFTSVLDAQITINWTNGNGSGRVVFLKQAEIDTALPESGISYAAETVFGAGTQIEASGWYCVYNGTGSSVTVTDLTAFTDYLAQVFEYNGVGEATAYNTNVAINNPMSQATSVFTGFSDNNQLGQSIRITLIWERQQLQVSGFENTAMLTLVDMNGKVLISEIVNNQQLISIAELPLGVYVVKVANERGRMIRKVVK